MAPYCTVPVVFIRIVYIVSLGIIMKYNRNSARLKTNKNIFQIFDEYIFGLPQGTLTVTFFAYKISQNVVSSIQKLINTIIKSKNV